jgi:exodeoxyribonuclease VII small subunit
MNNDAEPSFEQSLAELEEIAAKLEAGNTSLDDSLALYEKGVVALQRCHALLDKAEKRIRLLVQNPAGGAVLQEAGLPQTAKHAAAPAAENAPAVDAKPVARKNAPTPREPAPRPENTGGARRGASLFGGAQ